MPAAGADGLAVARHWLVYRVGHPRGDTIVARRIGDPSHPGVPRAIARTRGFAQLSRPSLDHSLLVFARNSRGSSRIVKRRLGARRNRTLLRSRFAGLFNPAVRGGRIVYVRSTRGRDRLMLTGTHGHRGGHAIYGRRRPRGPIWSTALTRRRVFFTVLKGADGQANLLSARLHRHRGR